MRPRLPEQTAAASSPPSLLVLQIDLEVDECPKTCENFLKLAKTFFYTYNVFFSGKYGRSSAGRLQEPSRTTNP